MKGCGLIRCSADDGRVRRKRAPPQIVTEYGYRAFARDCAIGRRERTPERGRFVQHIEVIAGRELSEKLLRPFAGERQRKEWFVGRQSHQT